MRLDKLLANATTLSRSKVKSMIKKNSVTVNAIVNTDPACKVTLNDKVRINGQLVEFPRDRYFLLHKPAGYICSAADEEYPSALKILSLSETKDFHFAGRLDQDTTGLVLITNDGDWSHRVTSPRKKCQKTYKVWLKSPISERQKRQLENGVLLKNESKPTLPARVETVGSQIINLSLSEGRYHQVKRMLAAVDNRVIRLHRESIGRLCLGELKEGEWRELTPQEIDWF